MIARFVDETDTWPNSWEDLRLYSTQTFRSCPLTFDEVREVVAVDWRFQLSEWDGKRLNLIGLHSGSNAHWEGSDPNNYLAEYLSSRQSESVFDFSN